MFSKELITPPGIIMGKKNDELISVYNLLGEVRASRAEILLAKINIKEYQPHHYKLASKQKKAALESIYTILYKHQDLIVLDNTITSNPELQVELLDDFRLYFKAHLVSELNDKDIFIDRLFVRLLGLRILNAIREADISLIDIAKRDEEYFQKSVSKFFNYVPPELSDSFYSVQHPGMSGKGIVDHYLLEEIVSTPRNRTPSISDQWQDDNILHGNIFNALTAFPGGAFDGRKIVNSFFLRSAVSTMRPSMIPEVVAWAENKGYLDTSSPIDCFDSSVGWCARLVGALFCNKGLTFKGYTGFDPNPAVSECGTKIVDNFAKEYNPQFRVKFYQQGIETAVPANVIRGNSNNYFKFAFTSPPFLSPMERYDNNGANKKNQAWVLYPDEDSYKTKFLKKLIINNIEVLAAGGLFVLHFKDEKLLNDTLELIKLSDNKNWNIQYLEKGEYYPSVRKSCGQGESKQGEGVYFFRRCNSVENVPALLESKDEESDGRDAKSRRGQNGSKTSSLLFMQDVSLKRKARFSANRQQIEKTKEMLNRASDLLHCTALFFSEPKIRELCDTAMDQISQIQETHFDGRATS